MLKEDPLHPNIPEAIFHPEMLSIRRSEGEAPIHKIIKWGSVADCGAADVNGLLDFYEEEGRNCHINTGMHGKEVNGKFEWALELEGGNFLLQDVMFASLKKIKISVHTITIKAGP